MNVRNGKYYDKLGVNTVTYRVRDHTTRKLVLQKSHVVKGFNGDMIVRKNTADNIQTTRRATEDA